MDIGVQSRRSVVIGAGAAVFLGRSAAAASSQSADGVTGQEAWQSVQLVGTDDQSLTLGQITAPVVIVHVWASWCAACLGELPSLQGWAARLNTTAVAPILVSHPKHWDADKAFLRRTRVQIPAYTVSPDTSWEMREAVFDIVGGSFAVPRTLAFAGRNRRCVLAKEGPENWQSPQLATRLTAWLRSASA